ncbi:MAG: flagellar hook-associated protein FlgL [Phycisphaerales bacterium]|nr:MAG: flagellar hook-associated protein FlgL [Phycisphaerales bacterium]
MAVSPINITRVTQNLRTSFVVDSLRRTQRELFVSQSRIATGRSFVAPSENPVAAARSLNLAEALEQQHQFVANLRHGDNFLSAADTALAELNDLLTRASVIASQNVSNLTSADEREAEAEIVTGIRQQIQTIGNRQFNGRYIFAGRSTTDRPFIDSLGGIAYVGDTGELFTRVDEEVAAPINMPGNQVFTALSGSIATDVLLTPLLTGSTRLDDVSGATGQGILKGILVFNEAGGAGLFTADLAEVDTVGDIVATINDAAGQAGAQLTASLGDSGLIITPGRSAITVTDTSTGVIASSLGVLTNDATSDPIEGADLGPRLTRITPVEVLARGAGIDLASGLIITNGTHTATIDLSTAETTQDIINAINNAGLFVRAEINEAGTRIDVFNQVSGSSLTIGENGGTTASDLGIRTFDTATPLHRLNFGRGVTTVEGKDDLRITAKDGSTVDVNLDGAVTVGDAIDLINQAAQEAGVAIAADFAETGNGIRVIDGTGGSGSLSVSGLNLSTAAMELGLVQTVSDGQTELSGDDVNPMRTEGIIGALVDLEKALQADDTQAISLAGARLDTLRNEGTRMHGVIGARSQAMTAKRMQMEDAADSTQVFLSQVRDLDYAEAAVQMQAALTQLQANLQTSSSLLNVSLLDFLR